MEFKKLADFLWPIGVTVLALLGMPLAIEQYPEFFKENPWPLPISLGAVVICWIIPFSRHERAKRIFGWVKSFGWIGRSLAGMIVAAILISCVIGSVRLFRFHTNHLASVLREREKQPGPSNMQEAAQHGRTKDMAAVEAGHPPKQVGSSYLSARCSLPKDFSPCEINCSVENPHSVAMSNVSVGFNGIFPYQTRLAAGTETHMFIKKQETLPLPMSGGHIDPNLLAFSVEIPSVPPKTALAFTLWSLSEDNQKACAYLKTTIRSEQRNKIDQLVSMKANLDADRMVSLQAKSASLFVPGYFMSSEGRRKVEFVTNEEERTARDFSDLYEKVGKTIVGKTCLIPVFAAERTDGSLQYFANAPPMMTWIFNRESLKVTTLPSGGGKMETDPHPPATYICVDN